MHMTTTTGVSIMRRLGFACIALLACAAGIRADAGLVTDKLNKKIDAVTLTALDGTKKGLHSFTDKKGIAIVLLSFECPVSNSYAVPLAEMHKAYSEKGVQFIGVCPTDEKPDAVKKNVADFKLPFPVFLDADFALVDALKATTTPEAFLLDHNFVLRYRGRIDNMYGARLKKNANTTEFDLKNAIGDLLAGKAVATPATKPVGCPVTTKVERKATTDITFYKDVLPVLQKNCQECHRPGEVGPFSLMTYKQAVNWAEDIKEYTKTKAMPPWKPTGGPGYLNDRRMAEKDIELLAKWVDGGTPEGDAKDAPPPRKFPEGWQLGEPDLVLEVAQDFNLGPSGNDAFRVFVLPTNLKTDKYVKAFEVRPGNKAIVHHTLNFFDASGSARKMETDERNRVKKPDEQDFGPGYNVAMGVGFVPPQPAPDGKRRFGGLSGWAPGQVPHRLPEGAGYFLPAGSDLVVQTHYHRNGKQEKDRLRIGLWFADETKEKIDKPWKTGNITGLYQFVNMIPAGKADYVGKGSLYAHTDLTLHNALPHMHLLGRSVKITMTTPEGSTQDLVNIKDWDYNWQETYWFKEPIHVKAGTRFDIEAVFDNSSKNPHNPNNPPKAVVVGEQTTNEMLFGFLGCTPIDGVPVSLRMTPPSKK